MSSLNPAAFNADLRNDFKLFSGITQVAQGFESLEGQITTAIGGREVAAQVSVLNAANMMLKRNDSSSVKSSNLEAFVQPAFDNAVREIRENAKRVSAINSASDEEKLICTSSKLIQKRFIKSRQCIKYRW